VNYYDRECRTKGDNPTIGLILCTEKNDAVVRYTLGEGQKKIFASRYKLHLPTEAELRKEMRREVRQLDGRAAAAKITKEEIMNTHVNTISEKNQGQTSILDS